MRLSESSRLRYLGGQLDTIGHIAIGRQLPSQSNGLKHIAYRGQITLKVKNRKLLKVLNELTGKDIREDRRGLYYINLYSIVAENLLQKVLPYMYVRVAVVEKVLEFCALWRKWWKARTIPQAEYQERAAVLFDEVSQILHEDEEKAMAERIATES